MFPVRFHASERAPQEADIWESLSNAGLHLAEGGSPNAPAIIVCSHESDEVHQLVTRAACNLARVMVIVVDANTAARLDAWNLLDSGASDVVRWNGTQTAQHIAARVARWAHIDEILASDLVSRNLVGTSPAWTHALRDLVEASVFTSAPILLVGESGTGKELAARLVHALDPRPDKGALVVVDCTNISPELSGSELFGHERGAFTGATGSRDGAFAIANGGTLFLDEAGELPLGMQAQLLRVVQEGTYRRVGGNAWNRTRFRLVAATNRDLVAGIEGGTFRRDLYYRLAGSVCRLPPLSCRAEDVLLLARHFIEAQTGPGRAPQLSPDVEWFLVTRQYAGNVRDLRQLIGRILGRHSGPGPITVGDLPLDERPSRVPGARSEDKSFQEVVRNAVNQGAGLKEIGKLAEELAIDAALGQCDGSLQRAAAILGVTDRALQMRRAARKTM